MAGLVPAIFLRNRQMPVTSTGMTKWEQGHRLSSSPL